MTHTELFAEKYLGSIFYFCLKKTGNRTEAEELSGDIALAVVDSLAKYPPPGHFSAWVWSIARRRYAKWADSKRVKRENLSFGGDENEPPSDESVDERLLEAEQYSLLRRELAFVSREYREFLVEHYIKGIGIGEMSRRTGFPPGTIKTRLYKARKILKEGMDMAREFGKRSYNPESIRFSASGNQPDGLPWSAVQRKIPVNILLEASNNLSSAEELSMELGIALPYMEEEIAILEKATLLEKIGDKYVTNFFIADKEVQFEIYNAQRRDSKERSRLLAEAVGDNYAKIRDMVQPSCSEVDFKWFLYVWLIDSFIQKLDNCNIWNVFKRPSGGNWGFCGYENHSLIGENTMVNHNMCGDSKIATLGQFAVYRYGFRNSLGSYIIVNLFADIVSNDRKIDLLTPSEKQLLEKITGKYAHVKENKLVPDISVLRQSTADEIFMLVSGHPSGKLLYEKLTELFAEVREILERNSNAVLHKTLDYYVSMFMCDARSMLMSDEVDAGIIAVPENPETSSAGTYLIIK